ncbi:MAG: hypothetical protein D6696_09575 [Acidobacteria bacterium]|nr:MAG: hypothetical protein D6696_09575 [Acidobacteriota bacterium]
MNLRRKLLWIDGLGALAAGVAVLSLSAWLSSWYGLPRSFLIFLALVNLVYASFSLSLAARWRRPMGLILLLALANLTWAVLCWRWAIVWREVASPFGLAHLVVEGLYVGILGGLEWRWRELLQVKPRLPLRVDLLHVLACGRRRAWWAV